MKKYNSGSAYEIELPDGINISPVFNIIDLTEYCESDTEEESVIEKYKILAPTLEKEKIATILDSHVKSTRNMQYEEYLVKWRGRLVEDAPRLSKAEVDHLGFPQSNET